MSNFKLLSILAGAVTLMLGAGMAQPASADLYDFTVNNASNSLGTEPFGSVQLTQDGANVDVVVTLFNGNQFATTGALGKNLFTFDAASNITAADITITSPPTNSLIDTVNGSASSEAVGGDDDGDFNFGIACGTCTGASTTLTGPIDFTVSDATLADLEIANGNGYYFGADLYSASTQNTGDVASSGLAPVPSPPIGHGLPAALAVGGLLLGFRLWERKHKFSLGAANA